MQELMSLFIKFFKIGLFTFGGGYAMLPLLKAEVVDKKRYLSEEELLDLYSIGHCTPGIVAVNVATFIGYKQKGIKGAVASTLGMILPSMLIIVAVASVLYRFRDNQYVACAFGGVRVCVVALIVNIVYDLMHKTIENWIKAAFFGITMLLLAFVDISSVAVVITAGLVALIIGEIRRKRAKK